MFCYLDLDGVCVDFVNGAMKFHNKYIPYNDVTWDFEKQLGLTKDEFWSPLGYDFWANLEWTVNGKELYQTVLDVFGLNNVAIMSSPCRTKGCADGKIEWIKNNMPELERNFILTPLKHKLTANTNHVLIDDYVENYDKFVKAGGQAILYPQPWNMMKISDQLADMCSSTNVLVNPKRPFEDMFQKKMPRYIRSRFEKYYGYE